MSGPDPKAVAVGPFTGIGSGLLGAAAYGPHAAEMVSEARLQMIERRILRIEMAMRQAGIEVEMLELPQ